MKAHYRFPLIRLPFQMEQILYLIGEELKSRKLFDVLHEVGLDDCYFQPHLDSIIIRTMQLDNSDEIFGKYTAIMDKRSKKIEADHEVITRQAIKAYHELLLLKKEMQTTP